MEDSQKRENCEIQGLQETRAQIERKLPCNLFWRQFSSIRFCCGLSSVLCLRLAAAFLSLNMGSQIVKCVWYRSSSQIILTLKSLVTSVCGALSWCLPHTVKRYCWVFFDQLICPSGLLIFRVCLSLITETHKIRIANCVTFIFCLSVLSRALTYVLFHFICPVPQCYMLYHSRGTGGHLFGWQRTATLYICAMCWHLTGWPWPGSLMLVCESGRM